MSYLLRLEQKRPRAASDLDNGNVDHPIRFDGYNAGYAQEMYERWVRNPASVDESWQRLFGGDADRAPAAPGPAAEAAPAQPALPDIEEWRLAKVAAELVDAYRLHGHYAARLDPLGSEPGGHPMLESSFHGVTEAELDAPAGLLIHNTIDWLRGVYSGSIGFEFEHLQIPERREWLRERIESGEYRRPLPAEERLRLLQRLTEVEAFEQFLHRAYLGQKRFSIEGNDMLVPMLDLAIERAAAEGGRQVVLGMAHRGRLNVLVHVLGRPYEAILAEFEGRHSGFGTTGDVKYHLGAEGTYATRSGEPLTVTLAPNPSHLEFVGPVVAGIARAKQTVRRRNGKERIEERVLPILLHGDAAFAAQGVVAETLNLAELDGYRTGGTLHVIVNNQVGFTTPPSQARSTHYASDMARGFDVPIFHVNADDPEACLAVVRLALDWRAAFHADVLIDLIGYRRYGHNEGDEPSYTQPTLYRRISGHTPVRKLWTAHLVENGVVRLEDAERLWNESYERLVQAQEAARNAPEGEAWWNGRPDSGPAAADRQVETAVPADRLRELNRGLHSWPESFKVHPKLARQLERRARNAEEGGPIDWAHAEALALASLVTQGRPVRLTGQDSQRGTFSQRHLVLHDAETGDWHIPMLHLADDQALLEIYNSPLSEIATVGFEYGYSAAAQEALVLWEAQFGDFVNVAQVIIDQFLVSAYAKWGQATRLGLLLPHGYEGQGPEHSSARLERFLQLAAERNMRIANCSTPAQYFHLLRMQALCDPPRPLVVMTPKSLLRHPKAVSTIGDLAAHSFHPVLDDADARSRADGVTRLLLCSGKVYYDLIGSEARAARPEVAVARVEMLYPFPEDALASLMKGFPSLEQVVWVQEEPENMGAWRYMEPRLRSLLPAGAALRYTGRPERASPAEGYSTRHEKQQARIIEEAFAPSDRLAGQER
jgi:2-oxoglutarate dehydrogenase E1 component